MSSSNVEPHDKMRARDVGRVARGKQAPRPAHEPGSISEAPPHPEDDAPFKVLEIRTAPADVRFPTTNQTRHCYTRYIEYHKAKGENAPECDKFARSVLLSGLCNGMNKGSLEFSRVLSKF